MGTNGGLSLTYHVHGSEFSSPEYVTQLSIKKNAQLTDQQVAMREVIKFILQAVAFVILGVIVASFGFVTGLEFLTYPLLLRKLTCVESWGVVKQSLIPATTLFANMIGSILGGIAIDKLGRRPVFIVSSLLAIVIELVNLITLSSLHYLITRSLSSLLMGVLYTATLLYCIETCPATHRLHAYLLHYLAQNAATTLLPLTLARSPMDGNTNTWQNISNTTIVVLTLGVVAGILFPEPPHSSKIRANSRNKYHNKFSVMQLENGDEVLPEPHFALYSDMFYKGGKVVGTLLMILFFMTALLTTCLLLSFPILHDVDGACSTSAQFAKPCMSPDDRFTYNEMMTVFGCSLFGSLLGYVSVQRYGRKNSYRAPAAFRVIVVISMVLCGSHRFMLSQAGFIVLFTGMMDFTLDIYSLELFAVRSRATSFGLLRGLKMFGTAVAFLINPFILAYVVPDLKFCVITVVSSIIFVCSLGLRKETFFIALNIEAATIDVGL